MRKRVVWQLCLCAWVFSGAVTESVSAESSPALRVLVERFLAEHPAAQAAQADLERAEAEARAFGQPLYNPELEFEYENATDTTKSVGVSHTFDWNGKRRERGRASDESLRAASAALAAARQELLAELLEKLSGVKVSREAARLSEQRVDLLNEFVSLAERRYVAGDVGQSDVDLAHLALAEAGMQSATRLSDAAEAESRLAALLQSPMSGWPPLPALPPDLSAFNDQMLLDRHPLLRQSAAEAAAAKASVSIAQRDSRPDPTLGLHGGREDDDTLVRLTVSIPLYVRNTYRAEVDAAKNEQAFVEGRIREVELILSNARIIEEDRVLDTVEVGAKVVIQENGTDPEKYTIVGAAEANPGNGYISNESPLGKALMGHQAGDEITVEAPNGKFTVTLVKVE